MLTLGTRISALRKELNLTQEGLSVKLGCSRTTVAQWERDANPTDLKTLEVLAKVLKTTPEYLAFGIKDVKTVYRAPEEVGLSVIDEVEFGDNPYEPDTVRQWAIPEDVVKESLKADFKDLLVVRSPATVDKFREGDRMIVDTGDKKPSPEGIFLHWDGLGIVINSMTMIPGKDTPTVRVYSANSDRHYDHPISDMKIIGRVRAKWDVS